MANLGIFIPGMFTSIVLEGKYTVENMRIIPSVGFNFYANQNVQSFIPK